FHVVVQHTPGILNGLSNIGLKINVPQIEDKIFSSMGQMSTLVVRQTVVIVTNLIDFIVDGVIILFITVYLLLEADRIQMAVLRLVPNQHRESLLAVEHTLTRVVGGYVRGQFLLSLIVGTGFGLGSWIIGLPYPLVIGVFASVMELIPLLGPVLGAILPLILALFNNPWVAVPEVLVLLAAIHLVESQILGPRIIRNQVGLHPVLSVVALMIGAELQGIWGALFAVPAAGILVAAWVAAVRVWREKVVLPSQTAASSGDTNPEQPPAR
ncbi:MAG: AI-2E family transporter, partial [Sulfobacillus sp.]